MAHASDSRIITFVDIQLPEEFGGMAVIVAQLDDKPDPERLFSYFHDEISFRPTELLGLTVDQANELRHKKDVAYLQS